VLDPEDEGMKVIQNVANRSPNEEASHPDDLNPQMVECWDNYLSHW
jgi:hypothetical protein